MNDEKTTGRGYTADFHRALAHLTDTGVSERLAFLALRTWHRFCAETAPPEPIIERLIGDGFRFTWQLERGYLDAAVYDDGTVEWFYKPDDGGEPAGTGDEREADFPFAFWEALRHISEDL